MHITLIKYFCLFIDSKMFSTSKQGNCLRFFELQSVSANAMRIFFDKMPDTFQEKIDKYENKKEFDSRSHRIDSEKKKDFVSRMYAFIYFNIIQYFFNLGYLYWNINICKKKSIK